MQISISYSLYIHTYLYIYMYLNYLILQVVGAEISFVLEHSRPKLRRYLNKVGLGWCLIDWLIDGLIGVRNYSHQGWILLIMICLHFYDEHLSPYLWKQIFHTQLFEQGNGVPHPRLYILWIYYRSYLILVYFR